MSLCAALTAAVGAATFEVGGSKAGGEVRLHLPAYRGARARHAVTSTALPDDQCSILLSTARHD